MSFSHDDLADAIQHASPAVIPYLTAGYPDMGGFVRWLDALSGVAPAIEVGIPFSDPMADGATIQESSRIALEAGATVRTILSTLEDRANHETPLIVMSYLNPLLAFGLPDLMARLSATGVAALVVPDLPFEESAPIRAIAAEFSIGVVQLVTPVTSADRLEKLAGASEGFTYAVTMTGTTGGEVAAGASVGDYLDQVRKYSRVPVVAGFGVRSSEHVANLAPHCDGVIVGSALVETISRGGNPVEFVTGLAS